MKTNSTLFFFLFIAGIHSSIIANAQTLDPHDSLALVDLYNNTNGHGWTTNTNWLTSAPVNTWYGITVSGARVTTISLENNNLKGSLPLSIGNLSGLQYLYIYSNRLSGNIPSSVGSLINLSELLAGTNQLSGAIPSSIGKLTNLTELDFANNKLSDSIPFSLGNLTNVQYLNLSNNRLKGAIPSSIGKLQSVQILELADNALSGALPASIGKLDSLQYLYLQNNKLSGTIPSSVSNLSNLSYLYLDNNRFSGTIAAAIGNITSLTFLSLQYNDFSGAIPASFGKLSNLVFLYLNNNRLSGELPSSLSKLYNLQYIDVSHNHLWQSVNSNPPFPQNVSMHINISDNNFSFNGLEFAAKYYPYFTYSPQLSIPVHQHGNDLSVFAGGTLSNNIYNWYKVSDGSFTTVSGDSTFHPTATGKYYAKITNSIATALILYTDTVAYTTLDLAKQTNSLTPAKMNNGDNTFFIYPNPAKDIVHVRLSGMATVMLTDVSGKLMLSKSIAGNGDIHVNGFAPGLYYLQNKTTGKVQQLIVVR